MLLNVINSFLRKGKVFDPAQNFLNIEHYVFRIRCLLILLTMPGPS